MKILNKILLVCGMALSLASCNLLKHSAGKKPVSPNSSQKDNSSPVIIENNAASTIPTSGSSSKVQTTSPVTGENSMENFDGVERINNAQFKYAILLDAPVEEMLNQQLIEFLERWYGTPYRLGGVDKAGVDCSAFVQVLMASMYGIPLPRTSSAQFQNCKRISKKELLEGDLVFFRTQRKKSVSHVGVYLRNNKFVHASTTSGVMISDLKDQYFSSTFVGAGRVIQPVGQGSSN